MLNDLSVIDERLPYIGALQPNQSSSVPKARAKMLNVKRLNESMNGEKKIEMKIQ